MRVLRPAAIVALSSSIAITALMVATVADAKIPQLKSTDTCFYVASIKVMSLTPRRLAPTFRRASRQTLIAMLATTRKSIALPRYDKIWKGTNKDSKHIRYFMHRGAPCNAFRNAMMARKSLMKQLRNLWRISTQTSLAPYHGACCWPKMKVMK